MLLGGAAAAAALVSGWSTACHRWCYQHPEAWLWGGGPEPVVRPMWEASFELGHLLAAGVSLHLEQ